MDISVIIVTECTMLFSSYGNPNKVYGSPLKLHPIYNGNLPTVLNCSRIQTATLPNALGAGHVSFHHFSSLVSLLETTMSTGCGILCSHEDGTDSHVSVLNTKVTSNSEPHNTLSGWCPAWFETEWQASSLRPYSVLTILTVPQGLAKVKMKNCNQCP